MCLWSPFGQTRHKKEPTNHKFDKSLDTPKEKCFMVLLRNQTRKVRWHILCDKIILHDGNKKSWVWKISGRINHWTNSIDRLRKRPSVLRLDNNGHHFNKLLNFHTTGRSFSSGYLTSSNIEHVETRNNVRELLITGHVPSGHLTAAMVKQIRLRKIDLGTL